VIIKRKLERNNSESCAKPIPVNLRSILEGIAQMTEDRSDLAGKKRVVDLIVQVAESVPETVMLDETFFMRICMNLLSNALKFTERGLIMIDVDVEASESENLIVKVQDTGIG
jgi:signal transduction histidine kinase